MEPATHCPHGAGARVRSRAHPSLKISRQWTSFAFAAFIGSDAAYQQYQQIRTANNIAQMQETTAMLNQEAAMDWGGVWGPYAPGWY